MEIADDARCFVCGPENNRGLQAKFDIDSEQLCSHCQIALPGDFQGWQNVVHGGVLATLLDEASIYACRSIAPQCVTAELTVRYKKPVPVETPLEITARVVEQKKRVFLVEASIAVDGTVHAEASTKVFRL
nr:PaaI family thioesterase [uncultured Desulfuromonas sp.]